MKKPKLKKVKKIDRNVCPRTVDCSNGSCKLDDDFKKRLEAAKLAQEAIKN